MKEDESEVDCPNTVPDHLQTLVILDEVQVSYFSHLFLPCKITSNHLIHSRPLEVPSPCLCPSCFHVLINPSGKSDLIQLECADNL